MWRFIQLILWFNISFIAVVGLTTSATILYLAPKLPNAEVLKDIKLQTPLRIYSKDQKLIAKFGEKRRQPITYEEIPPQFIHALIAAEDQHFFKHSGVDLKGIARAVVQLAQTGRKQSGGSTITMQVARNFFLTRNQTFVRKFNEILLALQIERTHTKEEILNLYINKIYLGHRAYGIGAAAQVYYGRNIQDLTLPELAMIAGLPKAPSRYNPIADPDRALARRNWILGRMAALDYISAPIYQEAIQAPVTAQRQKNVQGLYAPYIAEMVRQELSLQYGERLYEDGYIVNTTIDSAMQTAARNAVYTGLQAYDQRHRYRGAESKGKDITPLLPLLSVAPPNLPTDLEHNETVRQHENAIQEHLAQLFSSYYPIGNMTPAATLAVNPESIQVVLQNGELHRLQLDDNLWAKKLMRPTGAETAEDFTEILEPGDIVRVVLPQEPDMPTLLTQVPAAQAALVAVSPQDGAIQALVGGLDFRLSKFNRAVQAGRQVGSSIKPFIYASALKMGYTAASLVNDAPRVYSDPSLEKAWRPQNSGGKFRGPTRLREALYRSVNAVSIRLLEQMGVNETLTNLESMGFPPEPLPNNLTLALGSASIPPADVAKAFAIFANGGFLITPYLIDSVHTSNGELIFKTMPRQACDPCDVSLQASMPAPRVLDPQTAFIMHSMMQDVIQKGTGRRARVLNRRDLGGKTGTTNETKDAWFSGYSQTTAASVWVGFDDPKSLGRREFGGTAALPIWIDFMKTALKGTQETKAVPPEGIVSIQIDRKSGLPTAAGHGDSLFEWFRKENAPSRSTSYSNGQTPANTPSIQEIF